MLIARSSLLARRSALPALPRSTSTPGLLAGGNLTRSTIMRASSSSSSSYNNNTAGTSNTRRQSSWTTAATVVLSAGLLSTLLAQPLLAEEAKKKPSSSQAPFTKEDIGVICIIGEDLLPLPSVTSVPSRTDCYSLCHIR